MEEDGAHTLTMLGIKFPSHLPAHIQLGMAEDDKDEGKRRVQMKREETRLKAGDEEKWEATATAANRVVGIYITPPPQPMPKPAPPS